MSDPAPLSDADRVLELVSRLCENGFDPDLAAELNAIFRASPELVGPCIEYLDVHTQMATQAFWPLALDNEDLDADDQGVLHDVIREAMDAKRLHEAEHLAKQSWDQQAKRESLAARQRAIEDADRGPIIVVIPRAIAFAAAAIVLVACAVGLSAIFSRNTPPESAVHQPEPDQPAPAPAPAVLAKAVDAQWQSARLALGDELEVNHRYHLDSGMALLAFGDNETIVVEAPAVFSITGDRRLALHAGQIAARAEPGFAIETEQALIVDMGTAFGVSVEPLGRITTHVFEGKVRLEQLGSGSGAHADRAALEVDAGAAVAVDDAGAVTPVALDPQAFVSAEKLDVYALAANGSPYHQWLVSTYKLQRDPDMIAYYLFDKADTQAGRLVNQAQATLGRLDGVFGRKGRSQSAPQATAGRWQRNDALRFEAAEFDVVRVPADHASILHEREQLTIGVWVKPDELKQISHHLVTMRAPGGLNALNFVMVWEGHGFGSDYRPNTLMFNADLGGHDYPEHQTADDTLPYSRDWRHVVVTFDRGERRFYIDGVLIGQKPRVATGRIPALDAELEIGATMAHMNDSGTYLDGDMDELFILGRAMTQQEIETLYQAGVPRE